MTHELTVMQQNVLGLIRKGYENRVNIRYIANILGISTRQVGYVINELREFYPICTTTLDGGGVWVADNNKDIITFIKHLEKLRNIHQKNINFMEAHIK